MTTKPSAGKAVQLLESTGGPVETSGKRRDRTFAYKQYLAKLRTGTELDARVSSFHRCTQRCQYCWDLSPSSLRATTLVRPRRAPR